MVVWAPDRGVVGASGLLRENVEVAGSAAVGVGGAGSDRLAVGVAGAWILKGALTGKVRQIVLQQAGDKGHESAIRKARKQLNLQC